MALKKLFPTNKAGKKWSNFRPDGYRKDVSGVIYKANQAACGLALGGIATGAVDLDTDGTLGRCTCYNSIIMPRELGAVPFLALGVGKDVWSLTTKSVEGTKKAKQIYYWGHYPAADLQYETDAPIETSLRAWSPFVPGDAEISNTPAAVFEVRLTNKTRSSKKGTIAITLPGPTKEEGFARKYNYKKVNQKNLKGVNVGTGKGTGYVLAVMGLDNVRIGGDITGEEFAGIAKELPVINAKTTGASLAVDFNLKAGASKIVRFIKSWYFPVLDSGPHQYLHAYGSRFGDAMEVASMVSKNHKSLLSRIIAWQEAVYAEKKLPNWLQDCLVNSLYLLAEDAFWETNSIPSQPWAEELGMFSMVESTRTCPGQSCIPSDFYGNFPVLYFFPELTHSTLRGFASLQRGTGEIPIYWGQNYDRDNPLFQTLHVTSPCNYIDLVDRMWQRTGDDKIVFEFYDSVKKAVNYLQTLDKDGDGLIECFPNGNCAHQYYNAWNWTGPAVHVVGMWLSVLLMAQRMAEKVGDAAFACDCQVWLNLGKKSMEEKLWNGKYYLLFNDTVGKRKSDTILSNQLIGQWCSKLHGTEDVFPEDRVKKVFKVIEKKCMKDAKCAAVGAIKPNGKMDKTGGEGSEGTFTPEMLILAMTMLYHGENKLGMKLAKETMQNLVLDQGLQWDLPNTIKWNGEWLHGNDFDQMMIVWSLPAAILGQDLSETAGEGGFVDSIIRAGKAK